MPEYRRITTSLVSQFDLLVIPEFPPPAPTQNPVYTPPPLIDKELSPVDEELCLLDEKRSLVSVFIPAYSGSQFWISYSIAPPNPPKALYYFKLFLNGACMVSWGCGEEDEFKGKTMFGLYESEAKREGESGIQKRMLCFGDEFEGSDDDILEIKVYRCRGRRPCSPVTESYGGIKVGNEGTVKREMKGNISLVNVGNLDEGHPQNFYQYALIDPLDEPFATFRYYCRPWAQLEKLGVISSSSSCRSSVVSQDNDKIQDRPSKTTHMTAVTTSSDETSPQRSIPDYLRQLRHLRPLISRGGAGSPPPAPSPSPSPSLPPAPLRSSYMSPAVVRNQLSVTAPNSPTRIKAAPSGSISRKITPASFESLVRRSLPANKSSPSPLQQRTPQPQPPPPRMASLGLLKSIVTKAVRRRGLGISSSSSSSSKITEEEEEEVGEDEGVDSDKLSQEEHRPKKTSDDVKKRRRPNIPLRTSSSSTNTVDVAITRD